MSEDHGQNAVAIIGMHARLPGAPDVDAFWDLLREGREAVRVLTPEELRAAGVPEAVRLSPRFVPAVSTLTGIDLFDASFFGLSPREAEVMDPQLRIFLETAWAAMETAGYESRGAGAVGVFAGASASGYLHENLVPRQDLLANLGGLQVHLVNAPDSLASLVSYKLDLTGPSLTVQTACSTSLVAVHLACQSLLSGECDLALAGGVSIRVAPPSGYLHQDGGILSRDGHTRTFDARASGTVMGSGVGVVVLRRLAEALADGDAIRAVILGSAVNNDGSAKGGYTAPSVTGHARVVTEALAVAGVAPDTIGYVEAHGTGTVLGDPIEVEGLTRAFNEGTDRRGFCALGSVKTNLGHLDHAAGVASLIKTVLCLEHGQIAPSLHFDEPNPKIDFAGSPFRVSVSLTDWPSAGPRRAGVSSLGIGGTNAHVVLEEAPARPRSTPARRPRVLVLSARSEAALDAATGRLVQRLRSGHDLELADVAFTLGTGRRRFACRRSVVASDLEEAAAALERRDPARVFTGLQGPVSSGCVFLFPGQGTQRPEMARGLYQAFPVFRRELDGCCDALKPHLGLDLRTVLFLAGTGDRAEAGRELEQTRLAQPALFALEYSLARLWMAWGLEPEAMLGHSIGEWVAACLAGVFRLEDGLALVARRGQLMQGCPRGAMLAAELTASETEKLLPSGVTLAAINAPASCVASGPESAISALEDELRRRGVEVLRLRTSHAFHSPTMDAAVAPFAEAVAQVTLRAPQVPFVSNVSGDWITEAQACDPTYWARQLREPVRFADGVGRVLREAPQVLLEVGPGQVLGGLVRQHPARGAMHAVLASLPRPGEPALDELAVMTALGRLWLAGAPVEVAAPLREERPRRVSLPTYPFERQRYWIERPPVSDAHARPGVLQKSPDVERWLYTPAWRASFETRAVPTVPDSAHGRWLVLGGEGLSERMAERLRSTGHDVVEARPGPGFRGDHVLHVDPSRPQAYRELAETLARTSSAPLRVLHLGTLLPDEKGASPAASRERRLLLGLHSVRELLVALQACGLAPSRLHVVTAGAVDLGKGDLQPEHAALRPLCLVIRQEFPGVDAGLIDVALGAGPGAEDRLIEHLENELGRDVCEPMVALRDGLRFRPDFERLGRARLQGEPEATAAALPALLRPHGVYLITGGLGRLGLTIAAHLAGRVQAKLVLTGRTGLPPREEWDRWQLADRAETTESRRVRAGLALEALGSEVLTLAADAADANAMESVVAQACARFGGLHGVIHAAGVLDAGAWRPLGELSRAECERQLQPKVAGVEVLAGVLEGRTLDFVLLMSSLSSVLGGVGYGAYAAANHYLDAFAAAQHRRGRREWVCVDWDSWANADVAGASGAGAGAADEWARLSMEPAEALLALDQVLGSTRTPQVLVSTADLAARLGRLAMPAPVAPVAAAAGALHARPNLYSVYVAPESSLERRMSAIWGETLGIERVGLDDNFFELGGSSLLASRMAARVGSTFEVEMPAAAVFEGPTVRSMSRLVEARTGSQGALASSAPAEGSRV
jgi:phthiocerol/phenolphthiocerol synthesis type-I polyketide synthase E